MRPLLFRRHFSYALRVHGPEGGYPLGPTSALGDLLSATGDRNGRDDLINGFYTDGVGHGLLPGAREPWFQWSFES